MCDKVGPVIGSISHADRGIKLGHAESLMSALKPSRWPALIDPCARGGASSRRVAKLRSGSGGGDADTRSWPPGLQSPPAGGREEWAPASDCSASVWNGSEEDASGECKPSAFPDQLDHAGENDRRFVSAFQLLGARIVNQEGNAKLWEERTGACPREPVDLGISRQLPASSAVRSGGCGRGRLGEEGCAPPISALDTFASAGISS